MIFFSLSLR